MSPRSGNTVTAAAVAGLLVAAAALLGGCGGQPALKVEQPAELTDLEPALPVEAVWERSLPGSEGQALMLRPVADRDRVFAAGADGSLAAFAADTGDELWRTRLPEPVKGGLGTGGDLLLAGGDGMVMAASREDGSLRWQASVSSEVLAPPVRSGRVVVVRTVDGGVYGLAADDGAQLWQVRLQVPLLTLRGNSAPVAVDGGIIVGGDNGRLTALAAADGKQMWEQAVTAPRGRNDLERMVDIDGRLAVSDGLVFASSHQGRTVAITIADGRLVWSRDVPSHAGCAEAGGNVYLTDDGSDLWALSGRNGASLWRQRALHRRSLTAPAVQGRYLLVGDFEGYVHWLARDDGRLVARARAGGEAIPTAPVVAGERAYVMDEEGTLSAFRIGPRE